MASGGCALLDVHAYSDAIRNASTASSKTSTGHPMEVTFCVARPPGLSYFSVHCPALQAMVRDDPSLAPRAICTDAHLVLFRVPVNSYCQNDYFVYKAHPQRPELDLIPQSPYSSLSDREMAVLSCDEGRHYILAGLKFCGDDMTTFGLQLYRSKPDGGQGSWEYLKLSVEEPLRDRVCPIPEMRRLLYHVTDKVIVLGGPKGTVGWVDIWRGILLCDLLEVEESSKLLDMPFPLPAKGNLTRFLNRGGGFCRDVTVSQHRDCIKYVEMEIALPRTVTTGGVGPRNFEEWLRLSECPSQWKRKLVPGNWKVTVWSMPIPVTTWEDWHRDSTADMASLRVDIKPQDYDLLHKLSTSHKEAALSLGSLHMCYPTMSMDGDVVYLLTKADDMAKDHKTIVVTAVDVKRNTLCGLAKVDSKKITCFLRCCLATGISKHIKTTGIYMDGQEDIGNYQNVEKIAGEIGSSTTSDWLEGGYGTTHNIKFGTIEISAFGGGPTTTQI